MYKFKSKLTYQFSKIKNKLDSPEADYWKARLFGRTKFAWNWRTVGGLLARFVVWLVVFFFLLFAWFAKDMPTPNNIRNHQSASATQLFDRNGKQIYSFYGDVKRVPIESNQIPKYIKDATITAEDRSFYRHFGFDFKGMARAAFRVVFLRQGLQSGSTITQQYVKNALLDPQRTMTRKIKELILSIEVEIIYSKEQILTMYLNEIPYGSNAYGVEAAAETFFNKHANELTLAESATLAALPQRPTYFSPYGTHPDQRIARVNWIINSMADLNYISKDDAEKAKEEAKNIKFAEPHQYIVAPHFAMYVKELLIDKYGEEMVNEGGLKVTTTMDLDKQVMAEDAVKEAAQKRFEGINATNAAQVSIDPKTGQIITMVGSADFFNSDIDGQVNVTDSQRQPGSSFKPIVYAAAFKDKYSPSSVLWDVRTDFGGYVPQNYNGNFNGPVTMRAALAGSLNIPAVKTLYLAGMDNALNTAHSMGITTLNDKDRYGLSLVLGGGEVKLVDLVTAYGVFANQGKLAPTTPILKVENSRGKVLEEYKDETKKDVLDPQVAYEISSILSDNNARSYVFGSGAPLAFYDRQVAVKTGTTSEYRDAWTVGYTPQLVTGVWVGNNDNTPMSAGAAGAMAAAPIWRSYMNKALATYPVENFTRPDGITDVTVDKLSNKLPTENSPETITDIFAKWQAPTERDDVHQKIRIDKATGLRATTGCSESVVEYKVFTVLHSEQPNNPAWENPVRAAAADFGINIDFPSEQTSCTFGTNALGLIIASPANNATVGSDFTVKVTAKKKSVKTVDLLVDNQKVGTDKSEPFQFAVKGLSAGKHTITAMTVDSNGNPSSESISVNVSAVTTPADTTPPGNVSGVIIQAGTGTAKIDWTNPSDSDLKQINIYQSQIDGSIGSKIASISASPSTADTTTVSSLNSTETYWFTLRAVDSKNNENGDTNQFSVTVL